MYVCGAQWLSRRVLDSRPKGRGLEPHRRHCIMGAPRGFGDIGRMAFYFQGSREHWLLF